MIDIHRWGAVGASVLLLHCASGAGGEGEASDGGNTPLLTERDDASIAGRFSSRGRVSRDHVSREREIEFSSRASAPLAGDVQVRVGALSYDVHYDYALASVRTDGHGGALDRPALRAVRGAIDGLLAELGPEQPGSALHEQMLIASLSLLRDSGGMPLGGQTFDLGAAERGDALLDKSLADDGIACIQSGEWYTVSFDYADTTAVDAEVQAGSRDCNGQCGPACAQLTPWRMWTLDCLEHDTCCAVTDGDAECWTPLGECGGEYEAAMKDFLRGYDPLRKHCSG
ncbi:MAG TPA: hypothetical protein VFS67_22420 [Polyangiaceae bacterium]|jgi:hypothetical protein|nr:hypothetical protein [Polyangiaceae bacterium]